MQQKYIFFDLDGTLTESGPGIMHSVKIALEKMGREIPDETVLRKFIGPPLIISFQDYCNMSEADAALAVAAYREYYSEKGLFENEVYDGIEPLLQGLQKQGKQLVVATSKPEVLSKRILEHFELTSYFAYIAGSSLDNSRNTKEAVIRYALEQMKIVDEAEVLMVGDRKHDVIGAKACGIDCVGVLWGYGSEKELMGAGAVGVIERPDELLHL